MWLKLQKDGRHIVRVGKRSPGGIRVIRFFPCQVSLDPLKKSVQIYQDAAQAALLTPAAAYVETRKLYSGPTRAEIEFFTENEASQPQPGTSISPEGHSSSSSNMEAFEHEVLSLASGGIDQQLQHGKITPEKNNKVLKPPEKGKPIFAQLLKLRNESRKPNAPADTIKSSRSSKTSKMNGRKQETRPKPHASSAKVTMQGAAVATKDANVSRPAIKPIPAKSFQTVFKRPNIKQKPKHRSLVKSAADSSGHVFKGINSGTSENTRASTGKVSLSQIALPAPGVAIRKVREPSPEFATPALKRTVPKEKKKKHRNRRLQRGDSASSSSSSEDEDEVAPASIPRIQSRPQLIDPVKKPSRQQSKPSIPPNLFAEPEFSEAEELAELDLPRLSPQRECLDGKNYDKADDRSDTDQDCSSSTTEESPAHARGDEENGDVLDLCISDDEFGF